VNPGMTATEMTDHQGIPAEKVAKIIVETVKENIKPDDLRDIDIGDYV